MRIEVTIEVTGPVLRTGRLFFKASDRDFFPADAFGDRRGDGHKGRPVRFFAGADVHDTDIRVSSGVRVSPRRSFANFLKSVRAAEGDRLRVVRIAEREYRVEAPNRA